MLPLSSDYAGDHSLLSKRQRSVSASSLADDPRNVDFDSGLDDDNSLPSKIQFDSFLADPYRRTSGGDDDDDVDVLQSMRTSESCTFSEAGSTPLMRSLSSTDWSQLRYAEADDKVFFTF